MTRRRASARRLATALLAVAAATALASETDAGAQLHAAHCGSCHDQGIYTRADRLVRTLPALRQRVQQCQLANDLLWFDEEVDQVTGFLDRHYYRFGSAPRGKP